MNLIDYLKKSRKPRKFRPHIVIDEHGVTVWLKDAMHYGSRINTSAVVYRDASISDEVVGMRVWHERKRKAKVIYL